MDSKLREKPILPCCPDSGGKYILFHLRRDLESLYGPEGQPLKLSSSHTLLCSIGVVCGIDYLGKAYSNGKSQERFTAAAKNLCGLNKGDGEVLYQLRCGLVHEVSLSSVSTSDGFYQKYPKGTRFNFTLTDKVASSLIVNTASQMNELNCEMSLVILKQSFVRAISKLQKIAKDIKHPKSALVVNNIGHLHAEKILKS